MHTLEAIIVDDEEKGRRVLRKLLANICPEVHVVAEVGNIDDAYTAIVNVKPQLVFLDIQMPTGSGFSLLEKFKEVPFDVIFVTGYDQYAINAIKFSALDYLLKPVDTHELRNAVNRALTKATRNEDRQVQIVNLLNNMDPSVKEKRISVHKNEKVLFIKLSDIIYIEADDRYSSITMVDGGNYTLAKTLKEFEDFFSSYPSLIRISRSLMINVDYIQSYTKDEPCMVTMNGGKIFEVPRRKKQEVLKALK